MTSPADAERLAEIRKRVERARQVVYQASECASSWRMSIPPQPDDSDMTIVAALDDTEYALSRIAELEAQVQVAREALEKYAKCDGYCAKYECVCTTAPAREALCKLNGEDGK